MTKTNLATRLNQAFTGAVPARLDACPTTVDPREYLGPAREAVADQVEQLLGVLHAVPREVSTAESAQR